MRLAQDHNAWRALVVACAPVGVKGGVDSDERVTCRMPDIKGLVLGLPSPVLVYCDRKK